MNGYEKAIMYVGIGLGVFPLIATLAHLLHIPLKWGFFAGLYLILLFVGIIKLRKEDWKITKSVVYIFIVLGLSITLFSVYYSGASSYPYFEDEDPYSHSLAVKYIVEEKTAWEPDYFDIKYIDPYPPAYDILMATLYPITNSIMFTLKFFNALLCGLAILFSYFFFKEFLRSEDKGLFATFVLFALPSFMSHFIWAQSLALMLFPVAFYCLEKKWWIISALVISSIFLSQPSSAVMFLIMAGVYCLIKGWSYIIVLITGGLISGIYWFTMFFKYGLGNTLDGFGFSSKTITDPLHDTSGGIVYSLKDFLFPPLVSKMDQPTGIGLVVVVLVVIGVVILLLKYKDMIKSNWITVTWVVLLFIMVQGNALPFKLFPHRVWAFWALPISLLAAEGFYYIYKKMGDPS